MKEILLSIKSEWFHMVVSCKKLYEYRKDFPEGFVAPQIYYFLKDREKLTEFLYSKIQIIGHSICDNTIEEISTDELCIVFDKLEVRNETAVII